MLRLLEMPTGEMRAAGDEGIPGPCAHSTTARIQAHIKVRPVADWSLLQSLISCKHVTVKMLLLSTAQDTQSKD
jgi:hypothetical protein